MIPVPVFAYKWIAIAFVLLAVLAWGGLGWYGKSEAERAFSDYQLAAARVIADRLAENQRLSDAQAKVGALISDAYQKGKADVAKSFQPALADLQTLRELFDGRAADPGPDSVRGDAAAGGSAVPGPADPAGGPYAVACTDRPLDIVTAAARVAEDLETCAGYLSQLTALQQWVREVQQKR